MEIEALCIPEFQDGVLSVLCPGGQVDSERKDMGKSTMFRENIIKETYQESGSRTSLRKGSRARVVIKRLVKKELKRSFKRKFRESTYVVWAL